LLENKFPLELTLLDFEAKFMPLLPDMPLYELLTEYTSDKLNNTMERSAAIDAGKGVGYIDN